MNQDMNANTSRRSGTRIIGLFPALQGIGGVQEAGRLTAAALAQIAASHDWGLDFLSLNDPSRSHSFSWNGEEIPVCGFGRSKARFLMFAAARARRRAQLVLVAHPHLALAASPIKMLNPQVKLAVISHGIEVWQPLSLLRRKAFLAADILIAPSRYTLDQIVCVQGASEKKTKLVPWCLSPAFFDLVGNPAHLPVPPDFPRGLVVMTAARLAVEERYKGVDQLIRAVAQLAPNFPSLHLVVVGSGDDLPRHAELARTVGVSDRVRFFEGLTCGEIAGCYSRCDIFALPSTGEGFGFVFLEAMAFGKPVIGAVAGGVTDIVEHGQNGLLVPPNDQENLNESLERLLTNGALRFELGRKGAEIVRLQFRFDNFRSRIESILLDCNVDPGAPGGRRSEGLAR